MYFLQVSQWMVGIKRIVNELKLAEKKPAITRVVTADTAAAPQLFTPEAVSSSAQSQTSQAESASGASGDSSEQTSSQAKADS